MIAYDKVYDRERDKIINQKIGKRLKILRNQTGISRKYLGRLVGVSYQQIMKYEDGTNGISAVRLQQFSQIFNVRLEYFHGVNCDDLGNYASKEDIARLWDRLKSPALKRGIANILECLQ